MTPLQKLPKNVGDLGKLIVTKCIKNLPNLVTLLPIDVQFYSLKRCSATRSLGLVSNQFCLEKRFHRKFNDLLKLMRL